VAKKLSIDEIAARLALPKTTVFYWIRDLPFGRARRENTHKGNRAMQAKYRRLRKAAYARGLAEYNDLMQLPTFRDFVVLYIAEGYKRDRNRVAIANSDERVIEMAAGWLTSLTPRRIEYSVQHHADQNPRELRNFWGAVLGIDGSKVTLLRKSNSGRLNGRRWRCAHGVLSMRVSDTLLRARLQAWIDRLRQDWGLDSATRLGA